MSSIKKISLRTSDAIYFVELQDILYCKCNNSSTTFYLTNHKPIIVSQSIKDIEKQLNESSFFRLHQSYLVNLNHVVKLDKVNNYSIVLSDNSNIPTATRKRKEILHILLDI